MAINLQAILPVLQRSMPKASLDQIKTAVTKFEQQYPNLDETQLLALLQQYMKTKGGAAPPRQPFQGIVNPAGVK